MLSGGNAVSRQEAVGGRHPSLENGRWKWKERSERWLSQEDGKCLPLARYLLLEELFIT